MVRKNDAPRYHDYLFVGTHGHVLAVNKKTGKTVWSTSLPRTGYSVVSIVFEDGGLFCASGGRVFRLSPSSGRVVWDNGLPGMSMGLVCVTTAASNDSEQVMSLFAQALADTQSARTTTH